MIILDLDNCVSDDGWRIPKVRWDAKDNDERYHDYHLLAPWDAACNTWTYAGREAAVLTSRPEMFRAATEEWMRRRMINCRVLLMRRPGDHRPSVPVKYDQLRCLETVHNIPPRDIEIAYDDRADILAMYAAFRIRTLRVWIHRLSANWEDRRNAA